MDIISLYYFSELAKDLHITRTASRLYISQQTLSNHVARLEEYYGAPLLERRPKLRLTKAGEFVLDFAQNVVKENENLRGRLFDVAHQDYGLLRVSASAARANLCFPELFSAFLARYPNVELRVTTAVSAESEPAVLAGDLDFAVVLAGEPNPQLKAHSLLKERVYLCCDDALLRRYCGEDIDAFKARALAEGVRVGDIAALPVGILSNRMGQSIRAEFERARILPNIHMTSYYSDMQLALCTQGLMACFVPHMVLSARMAEIGPNVNVFTLCGDAGPLTQDLVLIQRRDMYLSAYAEYFRSLLIDYFTNLRRVHLERKV